MVIVIFISSRSEYIEQKSTTVTKDCAICLQDLLSVIN